MDKKERESRQRAARKFMSSLDEFKAALKPEEAAEALGEGDTPIEPPQPRRRVTPEETDLDALLEEAAKDIDRFMSGHPSSDET